LDQTPAEQLDRTEDSPEVQYRVNFPSAGTYFVWVRETHDSAGGDSIFIASDNTPPFAMDFSNGQTGLAEVVAGRGGPKDLPCPDRAPSRRLVVVRETAGETVCRVRNGGVDSPLLHVNRLGQGRILYLATSEDVDLIRKVVDWALEDWAPVRLTPPGKQAILTRQSGASRWVLHLLSDGDYDIDIDKRSAPVSEVIEAYPANGWRYNAQSTARSMRIHVQAGTDRLLVLR
jgi:hypothetical protein